MSAAGVTVRKAALGDVDAIVSLAVESVTSVDPLPVKVDRVAMAQMAQSLIGDASQFLMVAELGGQVIAAVAACVQPSFWFHGRQASMLLFWSRHPGAGVSLLRSFAAWVKSRPVIKVAVIECEPSLDARALRLLRRLGFSRESTNLAYVRKV